VPTWAKAKTKPTYTADEVGALPISGGTLTGALYTSAGTPLFIGTNGKVGLRAQPPSDQKDALQKKYKDATGNASLVHVGQINISNSWWNKGEIQDQWGAQMSGFNGKTGKYNELRVSHEGVQYNCEDGKTYKVLHSGDKGVKNGLATLDENEKIPLDQIPLDISIACNHVARKDNPHNVSLKTFDIDVSAEELNFVDGLRDNIQKQLDDIGNFIKNMNTATFTSAGLMSAEDKIALNTLSKYGRIGLHIGVSAPPSDVGEDGDVYVEVTNT
jgi:hypothetical protein